MQDILAILIVSWAAAFLLRRGWRIGRSARRGMRRVRELPLGVFNEYGES